MRSFYFCVVSRGRLNHDNTKNHDNTNSDQHALLVLKMSCRADGMLPGWFVGAVLHDADNDSHSYVWCISLPTIAWVKHCLYTGADMCFVGHTFCITKPGLAMCICHKQHMTRDYMTQSSLQLNHVNVADIAQLHHAYIYVIYEDNTRDIYKYPLCYSLLFIPSNGNVKWRPTAQVIAVCCHKSLFEFLDEVMGRWVLHIKFQQMICIVRLCPQLPWFFSRACRVLCTS